MAQTKRTSTASKHKQGSNDHRTTQVVARRAETAGQAVAKRAGATRQQVTRLLAEHPKVAASLAAGLITVGAAMVARKLNKGTANAATGTAEDLMKKLADSLHKLTR